MQSDIFIATSIQCYLKDYLFASGVYINEQEL